MPLDANREGSEKSIILHAVTVCDNVSLWGTSSVSLVSELVNWKQHPSAWTDLNKDHWYWNGPQKPDMRVLGQGRWRSYHLNHMQNVKILSKLPLAA